MRLLLAFMILALGTACASPAEANSLWGVRPTPTASLPLDTATPDSVATTTVSATPTLFPTDTPLPVTATPTEVPPTLVIPTAIPTPAGTASQTLYYAQSGDTLSAVAARFGVAPEEITGLSTLPATGLIDPATLMVIPARLGETGPGIHVIPDAEVVYSPSTLGFDTSTYVNGMGGYLSRYKDYLMSTGSITGAQAVDKIAIENSVSPRLLLALLQYESQWVSGQPDNLAKQDYPLGNIDPYYRGLFRQMMWAVEVLAEGYYGWRAGTLTELQFSDGRTVRLNPELNAGTVAIQYYFLQRYKGDYNRWAMAIDPNVGFPATFAEMFGDPAQLASQADPLFPPGMTQPTLTLPFIPGQIWAFTGGPHSAWELHGGALAALDFAPSSDATGCLESPQWVVAPAPGVVTRSGNGVVALDLDGDGYEQTGWVIVFLHIATKGRVPVGTLLNQDDLIGHPSCEGGVATGTHVHIARKFNGEWVLADGPLPFNFDGWIAHAGSAPYKGSLTRGDQTIEACTCGSFETHVVREKNASP
jgi:LasA protease